MAVKISYGLVSDLLLSVADGPEAASRRIAKINRDMVEILQTSFMRATLLAQGAEASPPAEFAEFIRSETVRMKEVIHFAGVRQE